MKYTYTFSVWPNETWGFDRAVYDLFRLFNWRVDMDFESEQAFELFRSELSHDGLTLREITRVPHHEPEVIL